MRIAQISTCHEHTPPVKYGSINRIVSALTEGLIQRGHDVTLYATGDSVTKARLKYVFERPREGFYHIDDDWTHVIKSLSDGEHYDIIHNHNIYGGVALPQLAKCKIYLTTCHTKPNMDFLKYFLPHNFVALSKSHARLLAEMNPIAIINPGFDYSPFPFREKKQNYLLYLGAISHKKGTREAIEVAERLGMELRIAGLYAPWDKLYFETEIQPRLNNRIKFVGEVGGAEKFELLSNAACLLFTSNIEETFGLSILEAFACGTPVVGSRRGAIPEVIDNSEAGFSVDSVEAMAEAVKQTRHIDPWHCRQYVEQAYTLERMLDEHLALYERLLSESVVSAQ